MKRLRNNFLILTVNNKDIEQALSIAKKVYEFIDEIGEDKMQIKSFSAEEISELGCNDIDYILAELVNWRKEKNQEDQERKIQKKDQEKNNQEEVQEKKNQKENRERKIQEENSKILVIKIEK
ncbi:hypothetical protein RclHR1_00050036 [Rhizophagus clarus]|uniref:NET domain-containing protein n=1 Tax=Rhizophagus clarus TaxID=94130 RepID=A0A2Z6RJT5_9GLOM|nr:hypothetical protein RclHR1_00050036 [Rhizophagus clarus]